MDTNPATIGAIVTEWREPIRHQERVITQQIKRKLGHLYPQDVTAAMVNTFCKSWESMAPSTRVSQHSVLRHRLALLGCPANPDGYPIVPTVVPSERIVSVEEFDRVLAVATPRLRLSMLLARDAALRCGTIVKLTNNNINFEANELTGRTKRHTTYRVQMTTRLREELAYAAHLAAKDQPLLAVFNRQQMQPHASTVSHDLIKAKKVAEVSTRWGIHDLRRTSARTLYTRTGDLRKVQSLLGHTSLASTVWYLGQLGNQPTREELEPIREAYIAEKQP